MCVRQNRSSRCRRGDKIDCPLSLVFLPLTQDKRVIPIGSRWMSVAIVSLLPGQHSPLKSRRACSRECLLTMTLAWRGTAVSIQAVPSSLIVARDTLSRFSTTFGTASSCLTETQTRRVCLKRRGSLASCPWWSDWRTWWKNASLLTTKPRSHGVSLCCVFLQRHPTVSCGVRESTSPEPTCQSSTCATWTLNMPSSEART